MIKRIHVVYRLQVEPDADRAAIGRAFDHHRERCPVYLSIHRAIDITTELDLLAL